MSVAMSSHVQALEKFKATAIAESERIEEDINTLSKGLDVEGSFTFHVSLDVQPSHSWNASYKDIKVRQKKATHECLFHFQTG